MSTYNLMYGMNPMTMFIVPALFGVHPEKLPRYNDCFAVQEEDDVVLEILSRTGKPSRWDYDVSIFTEHPDFIGIREKLVKPEFTDDTYAYYLFKIPEKHRGDLLLAITGKIQLTSDKFKALIHSIFPKIEKQLKIILGNE